MPRPAHVLIIVCALWMGACKTASSGSKASSADPKPGKPLLAMHDVSVLFPDAPDNGETFFLRPNAQGKGGDLIPSTLDLEEFASSRAFSADQKLAAARVVSFRIDPCFPRIELLDSSPDLCMAQLRLVLVTETINAFHAVYKLSRPELIALTQETAAFGDHSSSGLAAPLDVHPKMAEEGIEGPTASAMRAIILKYAGTQNLIGLAHFNFLFPPANRWTFQAFSVTGGKLVAQKIPTLAGATSQAFHVNGTGSRVGVATGFLIKAEEGNKDLALLAPTTNDLDLRKAPESAIDKALQHAAGLDNPSMTHFDAAACVSCHIASSAESEVFNLRQIELKEGPNIFKSTHNLQRLSKASKNFKDPRNFSSSGGLSQRTINESASVVDAMIKHGFYK